MGLSDLRVAPRCLRADSGRRDANALTTPDLQPSLRRRVGQAADWALHRAQRNEIPCCDALTTKADAR